MLHRKIQILFLLVVFTTQAFSIEYTSKHVIKWKGVESNSDAGTNIKRLSFESASYEIPDGLPFFVHKFPVHTHNATVNCILKNAKYEALSAEEAAILAGQNFINDSITANCKLLLSRKEPVVRIKFVPIRWNSEVQNYEKLVSFELVTDILDTNNTSQRNMSYSSSSVLSSGKGSKLESVKVACIKLHMKN